MPLIVTYGKYTEPADAVTRVLHGVLPPRYWTLTAVGKDVNEVTEEFLRYVRIQVDSRICRGERDDSHRTVEEYTEVPQVLQQKGIIS